MRSMANGVRVSNALYAQLARRRPLRPPRSFALVEVPDEPVVWRERRAYCARCGDELGTAPLSHPKPFCKLWLATRGK